MLLTLVASPVWVAGTLCSAAALVLCAIAPSMSVLLPAISVLGLTTVSG